MVCKQCEKKPVYVTLNHRRLCSSCFIKYFEKKVRRTIRTYEMIKKEDTIAIALSGGKDSVATAHILNEIASRWGKKLQAICIDEGIPGYRNTTVEDAKKFCKEEGIALKVVKAKEVCGFTVMEALQKLDMNACTICGTIRRYLLNSEARKIKATIIATGHNLDDEAQTVLMNQMKGNMQFSAKLGPITGVLRHEKFIRRIKPLYFMTEKEVTIYTTLKGFTVKYSECPNAREAFRGAVGEMVNEMEMRYPGTKQGIINAFLGVLPSLQEQFKSKGIKTCITCEEPSAKEECNMCSLLKKYAEKTNGKFRVLQ